MERGCGVGGVRVGQQVRVYQYPRQPARTKHELFLCWGRPQVSHRTVSSQFYSLVQWNVRHRHKEVQILWYTTWLLVFTGNFHLFCRVDSLRWYWYFKSAQRIQSILTIYCWILTKKKRLHRHTLRRWWIYVVVVRFRSFSSLVCHSGVIPCRLIQPYQQTRTKISTGMKEDVLCNARVCFLSSVPLVYARVQVRPSILNMVITPCNINYITPFCFILKNGFDVISRNSCLKCHLN